MLFPRYFCSKGLFVTVVADNNDVNIWINVCDDDKAEDCSPVRIGPYGHKASIDIVKIGFILT